MSASKTSLPSTSYRAKTSGENPSRKSAALSPLLSGFLKCSTFHEARLNAFATTAARSFPNDELVTPALIDATDPRDRRNMRRVTHTSRCRQLWLGRSERSLLHHPEHVGVQ